MEGIDVKGVGRGVMVGVVGLCLSLSIGFGAAASQGTDVFVLLLGITKLEGSELAVSANQAEALLSLAQAWRVEVHRSLQALAEASEISAAIRAILTAEQLVRTQEMDLSPSDVISLSRGMFDVWMRGCFCPCDVPPLSAEECRTREREFARMQRARFIEFADGVIHVLTGWASAG